MARRSPHRASYEDYSIKDRDHSTYLGTVGDGTALLYNSEDHIVFRGNPHEDEETIRPVEGSDRKLDEDESIADEIRRIADEHGWESVSEFAEEHLGADESESEGESRTA